jgi:dCTP deaminase
MILPAQTIRKLCLPYNNGVPRVARFPLIWPFCERTRHNGVTHGLSPNGYDLRIAEDILLYPGAAVDVDTVERLNLPNDICGRPEIKSTWSRRPLWISQIGTNADAGWRGIFRCEILMHPAAHPPQIPFVIKSGTGLVHMIFERLEEPTEQPYAGKYQDQQQDQNAIFERDS